MKLPERFFLAFDTPLDGSWFLEHFGWLSSFGRRVVHHLDLESMSDQVDGRTLPRLPLTCFLSLASLESVELCFNGNRSSIGTALSHDAGLGGRRFPSHSSWEYLPKHSSSFRIFLVVRRRLRSAQLEKKYFHGAGLRSRTSAQVRRWDRELRPTKLERIDFIHTAIIRHMFQG
jgi:hypothetical protein